MMGAVERFVPFFVPFLGVVVVVVVVVGVGGSVCKVNMQYDTMINFSEFRSRC